MTRLEQIAELLLEEISERFDKVPVDVEDLEFSEDLAEMLDRFIVLHIRMWKLEDMAGEAETDEELAAIKRKVDFCFKEKRPQLTKAINAYINNHISKMHFLREEENVKQYSGFKND